MGLTWPGLSRKKKRPYANVPVVHPVYGRFDSKLEAARFGELLLQETRGLIGQLARQVRFVLLRDPKTGGVLKSYTADFIYIEDGHLIVEDVKGRVTPAWGVVQKLWRVAYPDIELREWRRDLRTPGKRGGQKAR